MGGGGGDSLSCAVKRCIAMHGMTRMSTSVNYTKVPNTSHFVGPSSLLAWGSSGRHTACQCTAGLPSPCTGAAGPASSQQSLARHL